MEREIEYANRSIDKNSLTDLLVIAYEQVSAAKKISDATNSEFAYPHTEEIYSIVLDALGVPDGDEYREELDELFYMDWLLNDKYETVYEFYDALIHLIEENTTVVDLK